jgi:hypothetical protein
MSKPFCYIPKDKDVPPFVAEFRKMLLFQVGKPCATYNPASAVCRVWQSFAVIAEFFEDAMDSVELNAIAQEVKKARKELKAGKTVTLKELKKR